MVKFEPMLVNERETITKSNLYTSSNNIRAVSGHVGTTEFRGYYYVLIGVGKRGGYFVFSSTRWRLGPIFKLLKSIGY